MRAIPENGRSSSGDMAPGNEAVLSLGGNIGDVVQAFAMAILQLRSHRDIEVRKCSSVWRTPAWGRTDQPDFFNMAVSIATGLLPESLLELCQSIELSAGRTREERWGPRTLDIDIISFGSCNMDTSDLTLPHPLAHERAFVLAPVSEIAPQLMLRGRTVTAWLAALPDKQRPVAGNERFAIDPEASLRLHTLSA
jgi:2-amino-4-hydroxy-6-hydroxymethyldihydropteridine diphosphokinase